MSLQAGDFGVVHTAGWIGWMIRALTGKGPRRADVNHAAIALSATELVEMEAAGATLSPVSKYSRMLWFRPAGTTEEQRQIIGQAARSLVLADTGYSFLDIAAQFAYRVLHVRPAALARWIASPRRMVCSQAVDWCEMVGGVHLFQDGRAPGLVSPADLEWVGQDNGWQVDP